MAKKPDLPINQIIQGDCVELLSQLPGQSVDLVFADPPYFLQLNNDLYRPNQTRVDAVNDNWDKFASLEEYDDFTKKWLRECQRVLKPNGSIWVIGTYHNIFRVGSILQDLGFWIINDIVWIKSNPMPNFKGTRFNNAHETMIWAVPTRSSKYTFHYHSMKVMNDDLQMRSDWLLPICQGEERIKVNGRKVHSTQKPEELLFRVILATSDPGDVILDPFMGSGTTAAVSKRLGRNFIGFEREKKYVEVARERISRISPLAKGLLEYRVGKRKPKVPFGNLLEKGMVTAGEFLYSKDGKVSAQIQADSSLLWNDHSGSIHKICAIVNNKQSANGWTYWHVVRNDVFKSIDELREEYGKKFGLMIND